MSQEPGWFNDPYGRFQQRYWNGASWTEHVATNGIAAVDPLGSTTVVPFATPASAYTTPVASGAASGPGTAGVHRFLDGLGADARQRPTPRLSLALAGAGGVVAAAGVIVGVVGESDSRGRLFAAAVVIIGAALAVRLMVKNQPDLHAAAVGAGVVGIGALGFAIVGEDATAAWGELVVAALFIAAWALPGFRGRPVMLGIGTFVLVAALGTAVSFDSGGDDDSIFAGLSSVVTTFGTSGVVFLLAAAALLVLVWWLDHAGYAGVATSLIVPVLLASFTGVVVSAASFANAGTAVLVVAVGLAICAVGSHGDRRATTWSGALLSSIGVVGFFAIVAKPTSAGTFTAMLLISAAILIAGPGIARAVHSARAATATPPGPSPSTPLPPPAGGR